MKAVYKGRLASHCVMFALGRLQTTSFRRIGVHDRRFYVQAISSRRMMTPESVVQYWFGTEWQKQPLHEPFPEEISKRWFKGGEEVDKEIKSQFGALLDAEPGTCLIDWEQQGTVGALARIIVLDQFTRNCFRDTARMYDFDSQALASAKKVVGAGMHKNLHHQVQGFIFMPYMHSEALEDVEKCVDLFTEGAEEARSAFGAESPLAKTMKQFILFAGYHRDVVKEWGRYPHRNAILGRESTPEEKDGLEKGTIRSF